jgi:hypothetical protein
MIHRVRSLHRITPSMLAHALEVAAPTRLHPRMSMTSRRATASNAGGIFVVGGQSIVADADDRPAAIRIGGSSIACSHRGLELKDSAIDGRCETDRLRHRRDEV